MGETIHVRRIGRTPVTAIEAVHSPDDGGWYLSNADFRNTRARISTNVYASLEEARLAWMAGKVEWEPWY